MKQISWLFFRLAIPDSWEMTRYGLDPKSGLCAFADESEERLRLSWRQTDRPKGAASDTDVRQRLLACKRELAQAHKDLRISEIKSLPGGWQGVTIEGERNGVVCARYLRDGKYLCEAEISVGPETTEAESLSVLGSLQSRKDTAWRAYSLHFTLPDEWSIDRAGVYPGSSELEFRCGDERLRLFSINPKGTDLTVENLVGRLLHARERIVERPAFRFNGHDAVRIQSRCLAGRGLLGRLRRVQDFYNTVGWSCPGRPRERVYIIRYRRQAASPGFPEGFKLWCC